MKHALVEAGLRALREEVPTEESKRATLARLGIGDVARSALPAPAPAASPPTVARVSYGALLWLVLGVLLGVILLLLRRW